MDELTWPNWYPYEFSNPQTRSNWDYFVLPNDMTSYPFQAIGLLTFDGYCTKTKRFIRYRASAFCVDLRVDFQLYEDISPDMGNKKIPYLQQLIT